MVKIGAGVDGVVVVVIVVGLLVAYDGTQRLSKVVIESMALWIWIYDIPLKMMTEGFARVLGVKIGRVLQVGNAVQDYKRVKVDFPLAKPLMHYVEHKVKCQGLMQFLVKYENVPHFCFGCGRIGHSQRECPDEEMTEGGVRYGKELCCSPQKKNAERSMTIPAEAQGAKRALNFSGDQRKRMVAVANSANN